MDCAKISCDKSISKHRKDKKGDSVGFYIKVNISFKTRNDLTKDIVNIEAMFIELHGQNKNVPYLVAVAYQSCPYESDTFLWLENFETLLSEVTTKRDVVIIITGDINIDLIEEQKESTKRYKNILHSFNLHQHITKLMRKSKSLIDYVCTNVPNKLIKNDVIYTNEISDGDTPFVILINIKKEHYELCYKHIRDKRKVDMNQYVNDFIRVQRTGRSDIHFE